jgi:Domain of unknown function (DUF5666)
MMNFRANPAAMILASLLCATLARAAVASPVQSHPRPAASPSASAASQDQGSFAYVGRVTKVEYAANDVVLATKGRDVTITVTPTTSIDVGGGPGSIADIRPGVRIRVEGFNRDGALIAVAISVL